MRPALLRRLTGLLVPLAAWAILAARGGASQADAPSAALARAIGGVGITVADMQRSVDFYSKVLFFEPVSDVADARSRVVALRLGDERLELTQYRAGRGRPVPVDSRSNDRWFQHVAIIVNDMDQAYVWLRRHHVEHVSPAPQRLPDWNPRAGGIRAFYFKDPDGHTLEILEFPPDKGDLRWHRAGGSVFLGIDHTAIVVNDTEASLAFYRDVLGLRVAGTGENWGLEQERLNDVAGARLRITTLRAGAGPGVELLEYLAPRDGRPYPADARPDDLLHWRTIVLVPDLRTTAARLRAARVPLGSAGVAGPTLGARDPDGHAIELRVVSPPQR